MRPSIVSGPAPVHRINVTPIIDVALVLVIVLLVTAPLMTVPELQRLDLAYAPPFAPVWDPILVAANVAAK